MQTKPMINNDSRRSNGITRRNYLRTAGAVGIGGLGSVTALSRAGAVSSLPHRLTIRGTGSRATYTFSVSGRLVKSTANGANINGNDEITGSSASGEVGISADSYAFSGELIDFEVDGPVRTVLNGDRIDLAAQNSWMEKSRLPVEQSDAGGGVLGGKLYYFGGFEEGYGLAAVRRTFVYDPTDGSGGTWRRAEDLPRALWAPCGVATEEALYSFGGAPSESPYNGVPPSDEIFRYRPGEGWTDLTARTGVRCPYPNFAMGGVYNPTDGLIYCLGGGTNVTDRESATAHGARRRPGAFDESRLWTFDPRTERVVSTDLARMPHAKRWHSVALVEDGGKQHIHAIGGRLGSTGPTDSNLRYDIAARRWTRRRPAPVVGTYTTTSNPVIDNRVYLTHGRMYTQPLSADNYTTTCHQYDPTRDVYTALPRAKHRRGGAVDGVIDGRLYVAGGHLKRYDRDGYHDCVRDTTVFTPFESHDALPQFH